jgi:oligoendopeptidase F
MTDAPACPPRWRLLDVPGVPGADELIARSRRFARLDPAKLDAQALATALDELGDIRAGLRLHIAQTELPLLLDAEDGTARRQAPAVDELLAEVETRLRPFELAWVAQPGERAQRLLSAPQLARHRHYLAAARRLQPHLLPEHDEELLGGRDFAAEEAWQRLFEEVTDGLQLPGTGAAARSVSTAVSDLAAPLRSQRQEALQSLQRAVRPYAQVLAHCLDTLIADRLGLDELRGFGSPRAQTDLENELPPAAVDALLAAIDRHRPLAQRWDKAKASLLGLAALTAADDLAPIPGLPCLPYDRALDATAAAFTALSPQLGGLVRRLDREGHIDAQPRPRKRSVATCVSVGSATLPFVALTFTGQPADTLTLAHEIGHALHYTLAARAQTPLAWAPPTPVAETAGLFAELLVLNHLQTEQAGPHPAYRAQHHLDLIIRTVFRQAMITRFEAAAYEARAQNHPLTAERLTSLWTAARHWLHPSAPDHADDLGWAVIPHFVQHRFYNYAYALAALAASNFLTQWHAAPQDFTARYLSFLATGGAAPVTDQLARLGIDVMSSWDSLLTDLTATLEGQQHPYTSGRCPDKL